MQRHHLYWPRRAYQSPIAKKFRNLKCNIVLLTPEEHKEIHAKRRVSEMPTREQMLQKIEQCKGCKGDCHARLAELEVQMS
jgi:hypothetical protein